MFRRLFFISYRVPGLKSRARSSLLRYVHICMYRKQTATLLLARASRMGETVRLSPCELTNITQIICCRFQICTMHYHFNKDPNENSLLICGDVGGNVRVLTFSPIQRGPFRNQPGRALVQLRHIDLQKRVLICVRSSQPKKTHYWM